MKRREVQGGLARRARKAKRGGLFAMDGMRENEFSAKTVSFFNACFTGAKGGICKIYKLCLFQWRWMWQARAADV